MATILGKKTVNGTQILSVNTDPNLSGGTVAPIGSIAMTANFFGLYQKIGNAATDWVKMVTNGGVDYPNDIGGGNFTFDATRYKQARIELAVGTNYVNINNIKAGDTYIFIVVTASLADEVFFIDSSFVLATMVPSFASGGSGQYQPTAAAGAVDVVMVTADDVNLFVSVLGQNFVA